MKKIIKTWVLIFLAAFMANANEIQIDFAEQVAKNHYWSSNTDISYDKINLSLVHSELLNGQAMYYVFDVGDNNGFVIISADDDAYPVLAYSFEKNYAGFLNNQPPNYSAWMNNYVEQIEFIKQNKLKGDNQIKLKWKELATKKQNLSPTDNVTPLLNTNWDQGQYYNALCPADAGGPDGHVLVGCVATTMAQVMKYHNHPTQGTGSHSYYHPDYGTLSANFGSTTYSWASMPNQLYSYNTQVATLLYHLGVSVDMQYGPDASGAYSTDARDALVNYFSYSPNADLLCKSNYTNTNWETMLRNELDESRPIFYQGTGPDGGHAWVCDGYQGTNYFHFNWGWSGYANGYFYLSNLNPGNYTFNENQCAIFNIYPEGGTTLDPPTNLEATVIQADDIQLTWDAPGMPPNGEWIHWDQQENGGDGIGLTGGGTFNCASRWESADLTPYDGRYLTHINYYHYDNAPLASITIKVWTDASGSTLVVSQAVGTSTVGDWNIIELESPVLIDASEDLWFGYEVTHQVDENPAGVDFGPAIPYKGDMISFDGTSWVSMSIEYSLDFNWNISAYVAISADGVTTQPFVKIAPKAISGGTFVSATQIGTTIKEVSANTKFNPSANKALTGYNVYYGDGTFIDFTTETSYLDENLASGTYEYYVTAVYDEGESVPSNTVSAIISGGGGVDRDLVIIEVATGTWAVYCVGAAMGVDDMKAEGHSVGVIQYHGGDAYETTKSAARIAYYGVTGYPLAVFDGIESVLGGNATQSMYDTYLPIYEQQIAVPSLFEIEAQYSNTTGNNYQIEVTAEMIGTYPFLTNDIVLQVALTESNIPENWQGLNEVNFVCRDMIPDENGTDLDFATSATQNILLDFTIPAEYVMDNLEVIVFIQDNDTKEILQGSAATFSGAPPLLDPPTNLVATVVNGNDVLLEWEAPNTGSGDWIHWDQQENGGDGIGLTGGGTFNCASRWEPADLTLYNGMYLTQISYYHYENAPLAEFTVKVWTGANGGTLVVSQVVVGSNVGAWNVIELDSPVLIDASEELWFGYEVTHQVDENPAGVDFGPAIPYKGDMISFDGTSWVSMSIEYSLDFNWNLGAYIAISVDGFATQPLVKTTPTNYSNGTFVSATQIGTAIEGGSAYTKFGPSTIMALTGYNVYRNGTSIAFTTETTYIDEDLIYATYEYYTTAVYDEGESGPSNTVTVTGGTNPLDPPANLVANVINDNDVLLEWETSITAGYWIHWDQQENGLNGIGSSGTFYCASRWEPADLTAYDGMYLTQINYFHYDNAPLSEFTLKVWTGTNAEILVLSQDVVGSVVANWNTVEFDSPIMIDSSDELWFGYAVTQQVGENPAGVDFGPAIPYKGDMISLDGSNWVSMSSDYGLDYNWNLAAYVAVSADGVVAQPLVKTVQSSISNGTFVSATQIGTAIEGGSTNAKYSPASNKALTGYNIYRDGTLLDFTSETSYLDENLAVGTYEYYVTAVYDEGESVPSNTAIAAIEEPPFDPCEGFDDLTVGGGVYEQLGGNWWAYWTPGYNDDAIVSDLYSVSPSNSMLVEDNTDLLLFFDNANITTGKWVFSNNIYIPNGTTGYWNLQKDVVPGTEWGFQIMYDDDMMMHIDAGGFMAASIFYEYDTWYFNEIIIDLDNDWCQYFLDGTLIIEYQWTLGVTGTPGANTLGSVNFFANPGAGGTPAGAHFDNICFEEYQIPGCDNFDGLTVGGYVAEQLGDMWTTWSELPGTLEDALVTDDFSNSPNNSFVVDTGTIDLVYKFNDEPISTGSHWYSHYMYIPSGFSGYFNVQSDPIPGIEWVVEFFFNDDGTGNVTENTNVNEFAYTPNTWFLVEINFDFGSGYAEVYFNGYLFLTWENPVESIGGIDYFGWDVGGAPGAYYDDVCFDSWNPPPPLTPPSNLVATVTDCMVELTWDPPNTKDLTGYNLYRKMNTGSYQLVDFITSVSYQEEVIPCNTYYYFVTAVYDVGESEPCNEAIAEIPCYPPQNLVANVIENVNVHLQCDPPVCGMPGYYNFYRDGNLIGNNSTPEYDDMNLSAGTYEYYSTSVWPNGESDPSNTQTVTIEFMLYAPTNLTGPEYVTYGNPIILNWEAPSYEKDLLGYNVYRSYNYNPFELHGNTSDVTYSDLDYIFEGLYTYYITAIYDEGESDSSNHHTVDLVETISVNSLSKTSIFPNPATDIVNIISNYKIKTVKVYSFTGQVAVNEIINKTDLVINTSGFEPGLYLFELKTNEGRITKRIVVH